MKLREDDLTEEQIAKRRENVGKLAHRANVSFSRHHREYQTTMQGDIGVTESWHPESNMYIITAIGAASREEAETAVRNTLAPESPLPPPPTPSTPPCESPSDDSPA